MSMPDQPVSKDLERWRAQVAGVLRKSGKLGAEDARKDPEALLNVKTYEGVAIKPLYTSADAPTESAAHSLVQAAAAERSDRSAWDVRTLHANPDAAATRRAVLKDLENGASSVWLRIGDGLLPVGTLGEALAEVYLELAPISIDAGALSLQAADEFLSVCEERGAAPHKVRGDLGVDPYGLQARSGLKADMSAAAALAVRVCASHPSVRTMLVDARVFHDAGGNDAQELAMSLAVGVAYLRALVAVGLDVRQAASQIAFRYAVSGDQFLGMAKLRAARQLWAQVCEASGVSPTECVQMQHAVTSSAMMTQRDAWTNMLRGTVAGFAAGAAGADVVTVLPFDAAIGQSDDFARRIARATQALLLEESHVGRVSDPAGGSWYVESLTSELAQAAWALFQQLEQAGGWAEAWSAGLPQGWLAKEREIRLRNIARRKDPITGVSEFPNLHEKPLERAPVTSLTSSPDALPTLRYAQPFETLRDRSDAHLARTGARPRVLLATLGSVASHTARATYMSNLLQAAGIEPLLSGPLTAEPDLQAALAGQPRLPIACLCGADSAYAAHAAWAAPALRAAGVTHLMLAGKTTALAGTGVLVDESVAAGCDAAAVLSSLLQRLDVA